MEKPKVIVICGPTASGKTALSVELAKKINGEIISADSMQIYKDMDIGTAKPTHDEMQGIKHYLIDCVSPTKRYSVADFKKDATNAIEEILNKNKIPIIVGGTGLYVDSLIYEINYNEMNVDLEYRAELEKIADEKGLEYLYDMAKEIDKIATEKISKNEFNTDIITKRLELADIINCEIINDCKLVETINQCPCTNLQLTYTIRQYKFCLLNEKIYPEYKTISNSYRNWLKYFLEPMLLLITEYSFGEDSFRIVNKIEFIVHSDIALIMLYSSEGIVAHYFDMTYLRIISDSISTVSNEDE